MSDLWSKEEEDTVGNMRRLFVKDRQYVKESLSESGEHQKERWYWQNLFHEGINSEARIKGWRAISKKEVGWRTSSLKDAQEIQRMYDLGKQRGFRHALEEYGLV